MTAATRTSQRRSRAHQLQRREATGGELAGTATTSGSRSARSAVSSMTATQSSLFVATAIACCVLLLASHVKADADFVANNDADSAIFYERVQEEPFGLSTLDWFLFAVFIIVSFELFQFLVEGSGRWLGAKLIPVRGKHLDHLSKKDLLFINVNKLANVPFVYFFLRYAFYERKIDWDLSNITLTNSVLPLPLIFLTYDAFYAGFHWALHIKGIYGLIHKHHHHQKAPSRAHLDSINVNPIEFFVGEYLHLFALYVCCRWLGVEFHIFGCFLIIAVSGTLTGLNHTRYDIVVSLLGWKIYDSKAHDVHHRFPQSNYGQYLMIFDYLIGSYRPYDPTDRVNKVSQLDPQTGKSLEYTRKLQKLREVSSS